MEARRYVAGPGQVEEGRAHDIGGPRQPGIGRGVVVASHPESVAAVATDDPVNDDLPRADVLRVVPQHPAEVALGAVYDALHVRGDRGGRVAGGTVLAADGRAHRE